MVLFTIVHQTHTEDLYVGTLLPFTGTGWHGGEALNHSIGIALDEINRRTDILPGYTLKQIVVNTNVSINLFNYS